MAIIYRILVFQKQFIDLYICRPYIQLKLKIFNGDAFDQLEHDSDKFSKMDNVILLGDLNA